MEQWLRDELAREQGYVICPLALETYIHCNEKCEECEHYIDFKEVLERRGKEKMEGTEVIEGNIILNYCGNCDDFINVMLKKWLSINNEFNRR